LQSARFVCSKQPAKIANQRHVVDELDWPIDFFDKDILDAIPSMSIHNLTLKELGGKLALEKAPLPFLLVLSDALQL